MPATRAEFEATVDELKRVMAMPDDSARADALIAMSRRTLREHPARRAAQPAALRSTYDCSDLISDLKSTQQGRVLGRRFGHNSFVMARALGIAIQRVPLGELQKVDRPLVMFLGRLWNLPGRPIIQLSDTLGGYQSHKVIAHEVGHFLGLTQERHCDQFAAEFQRTGGCWQRLHPGCDQKVKRL